jgi:uncharacterized protein YcbK (DUF882 family)
MELKYFKLEEFDSPDFKGSGINMDSDFLTMLDNARHIAQIPFKINSGYRTKERNESLANSKPNSSHLKGKAADISCKGSRERWIILDSLIKAGFNRIGIADTFIHVDSDESKSPNVIWTY